MARTAAQIVIGNEILSGKTQDTNTLTLAKELRSLGIDLRRIVVVPDEIDVIAGEVNALRASYDWVFTSGGVGPTHDDVTIEAIARALGRRVVRDPGLEQMLRQFYGDKCTDGHLRMADMVEGTELVQASDSMSWPTFLVGNVFVLPGVPEIYKMKLRVVREKLEIPGQAFVLHSVFTLGDEGAIKVWIDEVVGEFPDVMVGSYPRFRGEDHNVRVTFDGHDGTRVRAAADAFAARLPSELLVRVE